MTSSQYSVVSSYQLMENHIAAAVLDNASTFSAYLTPAKAILLLSIGSDTILRASIETSGTETGWTVTDISTLLAAQYPSGTTLTAHSFAASGTVVSEGFAILLAVTVLKKGSTFDEVWLLTGPSGTDASSWLVGGSSIIWTKLAYDATSSPPIQAITAANLQVSGLYLEHGLEVTDSTLALSTVVDPGAPGELRCFLLNVGSGASPVWSYYQQEQDIGTENLCLTPGRIKSDASWGVYKLYALNGNPSLTYLPTKGSFGPPNATLFTVPTGASAIANLVYQPSGMISYTDLFVAADGFIGYFPHDQTPPHQAIQLITSSLITGVAQLHAVNCDGTIVVWGRNGSGQLFHTTALLAQVANPSAWQSPIALLTDVTKIAALAGGAANSISLFAAAPLRSTTATGKLGSGLIHLSRNASTGAWLNSVHPLPSTNDCITLKTYTTRTLLVDLNSVPQAGLTIKATVSADCSLVINGTVTPVATTDTLTLTTDPSGYVTFVHAISSLATPSLTLTLPDNSSITIDATGGVVNKLAGQPDLNSATYVDANGNTQTLVAQDTSHEAVAGVSRALQIISTQLPKLPRAAAYRTSQRPTVSSNGDLLTDLGDLVQWIGHVVDDIASIVFKVEDKIVYFEATIGKDIFRAVVNTVEDGLHALTALFKWIGAEIEEVFRWLAFLFDWSDFIAVKNTLRGALNQSLSSFAPLISQLQTSGDAWFANAKANIIPHLSGTSMAKPGNQPMQNAWAGSQPTPPPVGSNRTDLRTDPKLGWLQDRVNTRSSSSSSREASIMTNDDPTEPLLTALESLISDALQAFEIIFQDIGQIISGQTSASDAFASMLAAVETLGLDTLQTVFDALMSVLGAIASSIQEAFNMPIQIPILSPLYKDATGSDLTLLDVTCLVLGIGVTLVYKIATDQSPVTPLAQAATPSAVDQMIANLVSGVKPPSSGSSLAVTAVSAGVVVDVEGSDSLQKLTGTLLIIQAITQSVDGVAQCSERVDTANLAFTIDLIIRLLRRMLETIDNGYQKQVSGTEITFETIWSILLLEAIVFKLRRDGLESEFVKKAAAVDRVASLVWGIWHLVNIHEITNAGGSCPIGFTGEAFIELLEPFQEGAMLDRQLQATFGLLALRDISAIIAGITRF